MKKNRQTNQYDKIFRENLESFIPTLVDKFLHIDVLEMEELPDDLQHTKERKPDFLKRILDTDGHRFILHIEFQLLDDKEMIYRMLEYHAMLLRTYRLPIRQVVIYLGEKDTKMKMQHSSANLTFNFELMSFKDFDHDVFLKSRKPEEVLLAYLGNLGNEEPKLVVTRIVNRLNETASGDLVFKKYIQQLRVLIGLRKLGVKIDDIMDSLMDYIVEEEDVLYKRGVRKKTMSIIENMIKKTDLSDVSIADVVSAPLELVQETRLRLKK